MVRSAPLDVRPEPRCDALATMASPPRWQLCYSTPNLDSFTIYIRYYASDAEIVELLQLPVVYHRSAFDGVATRLAIGVMVGQQWTALPRMECQSPQCERCRIGRGGYSFCWVDERWTPVAAMDVTLSQERLREESSKPWPTGILQAPQPANGVPPMLTTMWGFNTDRVDS